MSMNNWVKTKTVIQELGISRDTLYRWVSRKKLKKGKHYRDISLGGNRKTYQWHLKRLEELVGRDY